MATPSAPKNSTSPGFFSTKSLILSVILLLSIVLVLNVEPDHNVYGKWHEKRIRIYYDNLEKYNARMRVDQRLLERHKYTYQIVQWITQRLSDGDTLMLPPAEYVMNFYPDAYWVDPRIFYYFCGPIPTVMYGDTARTHSANVFVLFQPEGGISIHRRSPRVNVDSILNVYRTERAKNETGE